MAEPEPTALLRGDAILARESNALGDVLKIRFYPFVAAGAHGVRMMDADGREYLDFTGSAGVAQTGYGIRAHGLRHPRVRDAIVAELDRQHTSMLCCFGSERAVELGERLCGLMPDDFPKKAWFGATGSDANDCVGCLLPMATGRPRLVPDVQPLHARRLARTVRCRARHDRRRRGAGARGKRRPDGRAPARGAARHQARSRLVGDVRGRGLMVGVELVADRGSREPAPLDTHGLVYRCFELGLLTIYAGLSGNVVELTPPLTIGSADVEEALAIIERALSDVEAGRFDDEKLAPFAGW